MGYGVKEHGLDCQSSFPLRGGPMVIVTKCVIGSRDSVAGSSHYPRELGRPMVQLIPRADSHQGPFADTIITIRVSRSVLPRHSKGLEVTAREY